MGVPALGGVSANNEMNSFQAAAHCVYEGSGPWFLVSANDEYLPQYVRCCCVQITYDANMAHKPLCYCAAMVLGFHAFPLRIAFFLFVSGRGNAPYIRAQKA